MRRWRDRWPDYVPRPKVKRLPEKEKEQLLAAMTRALAASPVLSQLGVQVRLSRGRFYIEREVNDEEPVIEILARITPILAAQGNLLLESPGRHDRWHEVAKGSAQKLIKVIASDTRGKFHGLGSLDQTLRKKGKGDKPPVKRAGKKFIDTKSGKECTAQEALHHYFGVPLEVVAEPAEWYAYHRVPRIVAANKGRTRVLVEFTAIGPFGSFGGTCLYALKDGQWRACTIRPSENQSIAKAEAWLNKRGWEPW